MHHRRRAFQRHGHVERIDLGFQRHHQPDMATVLRQARDQVVHHLLRLDHQRAHRRDRGARAQRHQQVVAGSVDLTHHLRQAGLGGGRVQFDLAAVAHARGEAVFARTRRQRGQRRGVQAVERAEFVDAHVLAQQGSHLGHHVAARRLADGEERHATRLGRAHCAPPGSRPVVCRCAIEP